MQRTIRSLSVLRFLIAASLTLAPLGANATSLFRWENRRENPGALRLIPELSILSTSENYDASGAKVIPAQLTSYKKTNFDLWATYGLSKKLSAFARLSMASVAFETSANTATNEVGLTASGSGLTEQGLGLNYRLWDSQPKRGADGAVERQASIDGQFQLDFPLYDNVSARAASPRQPLRGDGTLDLTFGGFGTLPLSQGAGQRLFAIGGLGYTIRNNSYSKAIPYQLQLVGLPETSGFMYRVGIHGFKSMTSDAAGTTALSPQSQSTVGVVDRQDAGRSFIVDALNSSYMTARLTGGYQLPGGNQIFATYVHPLSGVSTAAVKGIVIGAQFRTSLASPTGTNAAAAGTVASGAKYDLEARVKQANDRLNLIKLDRGSNDGLEKGQIIDVYRTNADGRAVDLVARGVVTGVTETETVVNLRQYKKEVWVQAGYIARRIAPKSK